MLLLSRSLVLLLSVDLLLSAFASMCLSVTVLSPHALLSALLLSLLLFLSLSLLLLLFLALSGLLLGILLLLLLLSLRLLL